MSRVKCYARLGRKQSKSGLIRTEYIRFRGDVACDLCGRSTDSLLYVREKMRFSPDEWGYNCYCKECAAELVNNIQYTLKDAEDA